MNALKKAVELGCGKMAQLAKHRDHIVKALSKTVSGHINAFKKSFKAHSENVEQRKRRVNKYGDEIKSVGVDGLGANYAIFSLQNNYQASLAENGIGIEKNNNLRQRRTTPNDSSNCNSGENTEALLNLPQNNLHNIKSAVNTDDDNQKQKYRGGTGYFAAYTRRPPYTGNRSQASNMFPVAPQPQQTMMMQETKTRNADDYRLKQAEKVETSIMQVLN